MDAATRNEALAWLKRTPRENECHLLTNVRCLSEGVDVPSLDAALFLSKRNSEIDVVQSVGRVMRRAPGKRYGYIVIPVVIPEGKDPAEELAKSETYGVVWSVLNALRAHDDRFEAEINRLKFRDDPQSKTLPEEASQSRIIISNGLPEGAPTGEGHTLTQTEFAFASPEQMEKYRQLLYAKIVEKCGDRLYFCLLYTSPSPRDA